MPFLLGCLAVLILVAGLSALGALIFMLLWNWAVVAAFGAPKLSFWVAWALWFLFGMLTARFRVTGSRD